MTHKKTQEPIESHRVITVEDNDHEPQVLFVGTFRECQAFIRISGLITLTIEEICE